MSSFLVTGGAGFIGSHLVERLLEAGHDVRVLDDLSTGKRENVPAGVELVTGCVSDAETVAAAMADMDGCFHLAAIASVARCNEDWQFSHRVNLGGGINVYEAASALSGGPVPVVYASSAAIYGDTDQLPIAEETTPRPQTPYGADKLGLEHQARAHAHVRGMSSIGLRFFNVYGPRQDPSSPYSGVIARFADLLSAGRAITIYGSGEQTRDFVYVGDVVTACVAAMTSLKARPAAQPRADVYNVCTGRTTSVLQLAQTLGGLLGVNSRPQHGPARPGDIFASYGDPAALARALGVTAEVELKDGLARLLDWSGQRPVVTDTTDTPRARRTS